MHTVGRQSISGSREHIKVRSEVGSFLFFKDPKLRILFLKGTGFLDLKICLVLLANSPRELDFMPLVVFP